MNQFREGPAGSEHLIIKGLWSISIINSQALTPAPPGPRPCLKRQCQLAICPTQPPLAQTCSSCCVPALVKTRAVGVLCIPEHSRFMTDNWPSETRHFSGEPGQQG